ncbi:hypothetical protein CEXT_240991 [Caerostris extrusa]|uniref:Uncharacterized protein n=1 Tax=Caerostris extrusa TaxID=172846 RepID=A0AAV4PTN9_CAEEX|nr:hypothetical protein CEXT_240991 [Caerostris extrusa]
MIFLSKTQARIIKKLITLTPERNPLDTHYSSKLFHLGTMRTYDVISPRPFCYVPVIANETDSENTETLSRPLTHICEDNESYEYLMKPHV